MKFKYSILTSLALILNATNLMADLKSASDVEVSVLIKASIVGSIYAKTDQLSVSEKDGIVTASVPLSTLTTENPLRDRHMKQDLGVVECPNAVLQFNKKDITKSSGTITGNLLLNNQTHPMQFSYTSEGSTKIKVEATSILNMKNWGIPTRNYLGVGVKEVVIVHVNFSVVDG